MTKKGYLSPGFKSFDDPKISMQGHELYLRAAKVLRVDHENMLVDLSYLDGLGIEQKVPVSQANVGYRTFLGAMPSNGDICIVGFNKSGGLTKPFILTFYPVSYSSAIKNDLFGVPDSLKGVYSQVRPKMKKIYDGEIFLSSFYGSDIHLDKDINISNSSLNEITIKSADQSINLTALNYYLNNTGVRVYSGMSHRNALIKDPFYKHPNPEFPIYYNSDGMPYYTPNLNSTINTSNPYGKQTIHDNNPAFIEHRVEVKEYEDPSLPVTTSNSGVDVDSLYKLNPNGSSSKPMVIQVLGTLIGNDPNGDKNRYGIVLKPRLFHDPADNKPQIDEVACVADSYINQSTSLAAAYTLKFPNSGTAFYVNKQGKYFANIASSSSIDPMGAGESAEVNLQGHLRINLGKNVNKSRSITMNTAGGVYSNWGFDNDKSRSWDATFRKGVSWNILGNDKDGVSLRMDISGDSRLDLRGSRFSEIRGVDNRIVHGNSNDQILGKKVNQYVGDVNNNYGGKYVEMSVGHYNQTFSSGISRTIVAPALGSRNAESTTIKLGNSSHGILIGSKLEDIIIGSKKTTIGVGNRSVDVKVGNYSVRVGVGNISISTTAGKVDISSKTSSVTISGTMSVNIKSAVKVSVSAPKVSIGKTLLQGIVTGGPAGHKDYITGLPLIGSKTCTAQAV